MAKREGHTRRGSADVEDEAEEREEERYRQTAEIVGNYVAAKGSPDSVSAEELVAMIRVTQFYPEEATDADVLGVAARIVSGLGYTKFENSLFWKMASSSVH